MAGVGAGSVRHVVSGRQSNWLGQAALKLNSIEA